METGQFPLRPKKLEVLQINLGYMCNQVCEHCHVDAGPDRKEIMTKEQYEKYEKGRDERMQQRQRPGDKSPAQEERPERGRGRG